MTSRLEQTTTTSGDPTPAELERQQRASAPTLRDLAAAFNNRSHAPAAAKPSGPRHNLNAKLPARADDLLA